MHLDHIDNILPSAKPSATTNVYRAEQENKIINNNRDLIYQYIRTYPGTHLRKISKHLSLGMGNIQYHLDTLEKIGIVKSRKISIYKVYYDVGVPEGRHESVLAILQHETLRVYFTIFDRKPWGFTGRNSNSCWMFSSNCRMAYVPFNENWVGLQS